MRKILSVIIYLVLSIQFVTAFSVPAPQGFINDFAGVLSPATVSTLNARGQQLQAATGAQIVVVILPALTDNQTITDFAHEYFNTHGIGDAQRDNGVLLVIVIEGGWTWIEIGHGLEGRLPDGRVGRIQDEFLIPHLRAGNFDAGVENTFAVLLTEIALEYDVEIDGTLPESPFSAQPDGPGIIEILILIALFGGGLPFLMMRGRRRGPPPGSGGFGGPMGPMGPGGFGGGRPGGGGFGGFGGGGGMSRGGGAGRRF